MRLYPGVSATLPRFLFSEEQFLALVRLKIQPSRDAGSSESMPADGCGLARKKNKKLI